MTENIPITCLLDRSWNPATRKYDGTDYDGTLIEISTENSEDEPNKIIPVGIILLNNNTFHSVPMEFIRKRNI